MTGGSTIPHFDYRHIVFGRVVKGTEIVHDIQKLEVDMDRRHRIKVPVVIENSGARLSGDESNLV